MNGSMIVTAMIQPKTGILPRESFNIRRVAGGNFLVLASVPFPAEAHRMIEFLGDQLLARGLHLPLTGLILPGEGPG